MTDFVVSDLNTQIAKLQRLKENWDSYGGEPITLEAVKVASNIELIPESDGGIQIQVSGLDAYVEIEVAPTGEIVSAQRVSTNSC